MFQEDVQQVAEAEKTNKIPTGEYEAEIGSVSTYKASKEGQANSFIINFVIVDGEFEGSEYAFFVTQKGDKKSAGFRASFYQKIGYVMPEDGAVDENTWAGLPASVSIFNPTGSDPKLTKVNKSAKAVGGDDNTPAVDAEFV